ncbi:hypothetical protein CEUSTIGMA_g6928.t1 [Chlamydomonas eustigma]|uniref:Ubiquitin-like domain-containing protein n=1 Tax=Chlamydomonas eustigma TaxID=1157962 RepID=A0A250X8V3_9CHLO|nr:hypothetical protein CEUSTIGMA_g6928.t1 [Chlamydomonas eustigma]|eukprot:GAX79487.1 hypothetical protein CEUSTIGMA_g6928.t1 [Chlamydomonas eustigma]
MATSSQGHTIASITDTPVATWDESELSGLILEEDALNGPSYQPKFSKYNPTPGTGRTGMFYVPPNNYPFYSEEERYTPSIQPDGGQLSEWMGMYNPTKDQAEADRAAAFKRGVPHGFVEAGDKYKGMPTMQLWVVSDLHSAEEYGVDVDTSTGRHRGGPFCITVSSKMRIEDLRVIIRDVGGIIPALQRLSFAGKHMEDSQRTLEHYGVAYWNKRFPDWPIKVRRF